MKRLALCLCLLTGHAFAAEPSVPGADNFITVSSAVSPRVAYALEPDGEALRVHVEADARESSREGILVQLGVAGETEVRLSGNQAVRSRTGDTTRHSFSIPWSTLGFPRPPAPDRLPDIRLAFSVEWTSSDGRRSLQRETFGLPAYRAPHAGLPASSDDWSVINLLRHEQEMAGRKQGITIELNQPVDGKATVVIEDVNGRRVRNLVSGVAYEKGRHVVPWDGRDDAGQLVPAGDYRWRSISHPGLTPVFQMAFMDGPGSNHDTFHSAAANGSLVFLGTPLSEGGYQIVSLTPAGDFVRGMNAPHGVGIDRIALAADERLIYAAYDGIAWLQRHPDKTLSDWKSAQHISLVRFDIVSGHVVEFPGSARIVTVSDYEVGPGSPQALPEGHALVGMAMANGRLYVANRLAHTVTELDPDTGKILRVIPLKNPLAIAARDNRIYAIADNQLVLLSIDGGQPRLIIATLSGQPAGLAVGDDGRFYISDQDQQVVHVLKADGTPDGMIGHPGGVSPGPFDPLRIHNPAGLVQSANGWLWVTEEDRWRPKRLAAYDPKARSMVRELFGPTAYGAPGASFDPLDHTRWIGQNTIFQLDLEKKSATPVSIMGGKSLRHYQFHRQDGRTFLIGSSSETHGSGVTWIQEQLKDGTLRPLALISSAHRFAFDCNWHPPEAFIEAFRRDLPDVDYRTGIEGQPGHGFGMLWVDRDGDTELSADEIEFTDGQSLFFPGPYWGLDLHDLTIRLPAMVNNRPVLVSLAPDGWWPTGAPRYPTLKSAALTGLPIDAVGAPFFGESTVDRFGTTIVNSDPAMTAFAPDGARLWTYPNRWTNVHGSHKAPLPTPGELQGVLFFCGVAPLDENTDVMAMVSNHGRLFLMTTDGLYIDEMFPDVRLTSTQSFTDRGILGGEAFGGSFARSEKDGNYYFQGGGIEYRVFRVDGLRHITRADGRITVTGRQDAAQASIRRNALPGGQRAGGLTIPVSTTARVIDGMATDWPQTPLLGWSQAGGRFPVSLHASHDTEYLYLLYDVRDESPWLNQGDDWRMLFKTGDGVDLQLGSDPNANPNRTGPVPGDLRLFVAPFRDKPVAVLYNHRMPGAPERENAIFQSPSRSEKVDSVRLLTEARIAVQRHETGYRVEIAVPLAVLGLKDRIGTALIGDFGVIYGDAAGTVNILRNYWSNRSTGLVNDVPGEIILTPDQWGQVRLEKK